MFYETTKAQESYLARLSRLVTTYFDLEELRSLCLDLRVDYDTLRGEGKEGKSRELILYMARQQRLDDLLSTVRLTRPKLDWPSPPEPFDLSRELRIATTDNSQVASLSLSLTECERGLRKLKEHYELRKSEVPRLNSLVPDFQVLEMRLKKNFQNEFVNGSTAQIIRERMEIIRVLDLITQISLQDKNFSDLCRPSTPPEKLNNLVWPQPATRLPPLPNGTHFLNRFMILGFIGRGGFSEAYIAWDKSIDRQVVIKRLAANEHQPKFMNRFVDREIKLARKLSTEIPGLVKTYEVIRDRSEVCLVQENLQGHSLHNRIEDFGVIDSREALHISLKIGETLQHLHARRIAHCDVKPLNIIIRPSKDPTLIDLGAARFFDEQLFEGDIVISVLYSPPELTTGNPIDGRVDVYSLGMTLLHMLAGLPKFAMSIDSMPLPKEFLGWAPSERYIHAHIEACLREVEPVSLRSTIKRALAATPEDRYLSMEDFCYALDAEATRFGKN